jgi:hypothetical protein
MRNGAAAFALILTGCGTVQLVRVPEVSEPACTATCNAHYEQCPQVFANFPERGAVECPAEHNQCLKACEAAQGPARMAAAPRASAVASKEARLRELKHFYEEGLVTENVYRERQTAILGEPSF